MMMSKEVLFLISKNLLLTTRTMISKSIQDFIKKIGEFEVVLQAGTSGTA